jgi:hypothetical protein
MKKERSKIKKKEAGKKRATLVRFLATAPMKGEEQQKESPFDLLIESCFNGTEQEKRANIKAASKRIEATTEKGRALLVHAAITLLNTSDKQTQREAAVVLSSHDVGRQVEE